MKQKADKKKQKNVQVDVKENNDFKKRALIISILLILAVCAYLIYDSMSNPSIQDDAFITFRYVENFVGGKGLVFNEGERVEGITSILWALTLSLFVYFRLDVIATAQYLSMGFALLTLLMIYLLAKSIVTRMVPQKDSSVTDKKKIITTEFFSLLPVIFVGFMGAYRYWAISGMEFTMFIFFVVGGLYYYLIERENKKSNYISFLFFMLASLTRPEGILIFGLILLHKWFYIYKTKGFPELKKEIFVRENLLALAIFIVPNLIVVIIRLIYYGYLLPNTFYAKTGFSFVYIAAGLEYAFKFAKFYLLFGLVFILPIYLLRRKGIKFELTLFYTVIVVYTIYLIMIGGDVLPAYRFFLPIAPVLFVLFSLFLLELFNQLTSRIKRIGANTGLMLVFLLAAGTVYFNYSHIKPELTRQVFLENELIKKMQATGDWLTNKQLMSKKPLVVAASTIGAISYYAQDVVIVDMLGLTDEEIAHNPKPIEQISGKDVGWKERNYNVDYVLSRKPDYIIFSTGIKPSAYAERALFTSEEFLINYYQYFAAYSGGLSNMLYKRKPYDQLQLYFSKFPPNPDYSMDFIGLYNKALNMIRDTSKSNEVLKTAEEMTKIAPYYFSPPYQIMSDIYLTKKDTVKADSLMKKALEIDPYNFFSRITMVRDAVNKKDSVAFRENMTILNEYNPEYINAMQSESRRVKAIQNQQQAGRQQK